MLFSEQEPPFRQSLQSFLQVSPTFLYPGRHLHIKDPAKLKQSAFSGQTDLSRHSFTSLQIVPFPVYPALQRHSFSGSTLSLSATQTALRSHTAPSQVPSLKQSKPSPKYPILHRQRYVPGRLTQVAFLWHLWIGCAHSSISLQLRPSPEKPSIHSQNLSPFDNVIHSASAAHTTPAHVPSGLQSNPSPSKPRLHEQL